MMKRYSQLLTLAAVAIPLTPLMLLAQTSKLSQELQKVTATQDVLVMFAKVPTKAILGTVTASGGTLKKAIPSSRFALYSLPPASVTALGSNSNVRYATPNRLVKRKLEFAVPAIGGVQALQYGYDGSGVGVAVIDSGVSAHQDLGSRVVYSENLVDGSNSATDAYGHGTQVAGVIGGSGKQSNSSSSIYTFRGIAPNAKIINLRVLDGAGIGSDFLVISAIQRAIALKSQYNIRVLNLSLGRQVMESYTLDPLCQAVEDAWRAGIVVVVAAGNNGRDGSMNTSGYSTITSPGNDPYVITVGAMKDMGSANRSDDLIASYSSKGPTLLDQIAKPDLVAPGNNIISTLASNGSLPPSYPDNVVPVAYYTLTTASNTSSQYFKLSGTSFSAPLVAGAAALMIQKDSSLTPDTVKARLMKTASKDFPQSSVSCDVASGQCYTSYYDLFTVGAGYLDVWAALNCTDVVGSRYTALSPKVTADNKGVIQMVRSNSVVWGSSIVWGTSIVWGASVSADTVVEPSSIVWGATTLQGYSVVWGTSIVWGTTTPFSESLSIRGE